ncbi:MAG: hypothetical protein AB7J13_01520 [Pyrinomonadaceae bacterium]
MFEQSLYEHHPPAAPAPEQVVEGDLFRGYEIKNWELSSRIYKIIGISAVANILGLVIVAQTSLLTTKGCDSPFVGSVCQVLDTVYVGSVLFGTDREYVDAVYEKTELGDAEITFVDVTGETPPISYPEGYFQIANPVEYQAMLDALNNPDGVPGMNDLGAMNVTPPSTSGGSLFDTKPNIPNAPPDVIDGDLPTFNNGGVASNPTVRKPPRGRRVTPPATRRPENEDTVADANTNVNANTADPNANTVADANGGNTKTEPTPAADVAEADKFGVYINKRPLRDRATDTVAKVEADQVDLDTNFKVSVSATIGLGKDGKTVVLKNPRPVPPEKGFRNDPGMEKLVQDWIIAVGDAGWFGYIERLDENKKVKEKRVVVTVEQNETDFFAVIRADQPDENVAKTLSSGLNALLALAAPATSGDEQMFLKAATSTSEGKALILNVRLPKPQVQEMIERKLAEQKAKPKEPNGSAAVRMRNNLAVR